MTPVQLGALVVFAGWLVGPGLYGPAKAGDDVRHGHHAGAQVARQSAQASQPSAAPSGNAAEGRKVYVSYGCYQCHGREAQGSSATGPRLGPRPLPFAVFSRYVRRPTGQMPPYSQKVMSDADMADVFAFVESRPAPLPVESIPLLK